MVLISSNETLSPNDHEIALNITNMFFVSYDHFREWMHVDFNVNNV